MILAPGAHRRLPVFYIVIDSDLSLALLPFTWCWQEKLYHALCKRSSPDSPFTSYFEGDSQMVLTTEMRLSAGVKWFSLLFSRKTKQHTPDGAPAPTCCQYAKFGEANPYFCLSLLQPHFTYLPFSTVCLLPASPCPPTKYLSLAKEIPMKTEVRSLET